MTFSPPKYPSQEACCLCHVLVNHNQELWNSDKIITIQNIPVIFSPEILHLSRVQNRIMPLSRTQLKNTPEMHRITIILDALCLFWQSGIWEGPSHPHLTRIELTPAVIPGSHLTTALPPNDDLSSQMLAPQLHIYYLNYFQLHCCVAGEWMHSNWIQENPRLLKQ